jgi:hypothetical protein
LFHLPRDAESGVLKTIPTAYRKESSLGGKAARRLLP